MSTQKLLLFALLGRTRVLYLLLALSVLSVAVMLERAPHVPVASAPPRFRAAFPET